MRRYSLFINKYYGISIGRKKKRDIHLFARVTLEIFKTFV